MKKLAASLMVLLLTLTGCLEFDAQEITLRFDADADRIDIHIVYRGLHAEGGNGKTEDPVQKAVQDLADARRNGTVALWQNWPLRFHLTEEQPPAVRALLDHLDIENGTLFTDAQGVLCADQFVRIRSASAFLKQVNTLLELWSGQQLLTGTNGRGGKHRWDRDTAERLREFLAGGAKLLVARPERLELRLPLSPADHAWFRQQIETRLLDNVREEILRAAAVDARRAGGGEVTDTSITDAEIAVPGQRLRQALQRAASHRFSWDNELAIVREPESTAIFLGVATSDGLRLTKAPDGLYHPLLLDSLRQQGETIVAGLSAADLTRRFVEFGQRDAVLPPSVAAARSRRTGTTGK